MTYGIFDEHRKEWIANHGDPHSHEFPTRARALRVARQLRRVYPGLKLRVAEKENQKMSEEMKAALLALADAAVSAGRANWDGYYGRDNSFHLENLEGWDEYRKVAELMEKEKSR